MDADATRAWDVFVSTTMEFLPNTRTNRQTCTPD